MAAFDTTRTQQGALIGGRLFNIVSLLVSSVRDWNDARITRHALAKLSDRELEDIGLCRGDIELIASGRK